MNATSSSTAPDVPPLSDRAAALRHIDPDVFSALARPGTGRWLLGVAKKPLYTETPKGIV